MSHELYEALAITSKIKKCPYYALSNSLYNELKKMEIDNLYVKEKQEVLISINKKDSDLFGWHFQAEPILFSDQFKCSGSLFYKDGSTLGFKDLSDNSRRFISAQSLKLMYYIENRESLLNTKIPKKYKKIAKKSYEFEYILPDFEYIKHLNQKLWDVCGHFRLQPCGPKNSLRKKIWIKNHKKGHKILKKD